MGTSKAAQISKIRAEHAADAKRIRAEYVAEKKVITEKWKTGIAALKKENDQLHLGAQETYYEEMHKNDSWLREQIAMLETGGQ